jgi:hypothetical protein
LWKIVSIHPAVSDLSKIGKVTALLTGLEEYWDVENDHATHVFSANPDGKTQSAVYNDNAPGEFNNIEKFSTSAGLMQISASATKVEAVLGCSRRPGRHLRRTRP